MSLAIAIVTVTVATLSVVNAGVTQENIRSKRQTINTCEKIQGKNCGVSFDSATPLLAMGKNTTIGTSPWNVAIYRNEFNKKNDFEFICGGSLITPNLVISAAHCFWEEGSKGGLIINDNMYKIGVGKYEKDISIIDNIYTKIMDVKSIHTDPDYQGVGGNFLYDMAIVVLSNNIEFSKFVMPVCIDWAKHYSILKNSTGKIVGWGLNEHDEPSSVLKEANLPYIDRDECKRINSYGFRVYLTKERFCAGSLAHQGVRQGDSGAGLTFEYDNLQYLRGVVSLRDLEINNSVALFTDVSYNSRWICDTIMNYTDIKKMFLGATFVKKPVNQAPSSRSCENYEFRCSSGQCVSKLSVCNIDIDCDDGSDEDKDLCETRQCQPYEFRCTNGQCIHVQDVCDLAIQCKDGSDEDTEMCKNRTCDADKFKCSKGRCIVKEWVCDGIPNCVGDANDEDIEMCKTYSCLENKFKCTNNQCIGSNTVCNGYKDCIDGSDEDINMCKTRSCAVNEFKCKDNSGQCILKANVCNKKKECRDGSDEHVKLCRSWHF